MYGSKLLLALLFGSMIVAVGGAKEFCCHEDKSAKDAKDPLNATFVRLKSLVGDWETATQLGDIPKGKIASQFRLTGGGSALTETIFPGSELEMLSVYHRDGDQLLMTHYCVAGNQPRLRVKIGKDKDELIFEFAGGTNMDPAKDMHIHSGLIRFVDADHIHSEWEMYAGDKAHGKHSFDLVRVKK